MRKFGLNTIAACTAWRLGVADAIKEAGSVIATTARAVLRWHRERLSVDPKYAVALAAGGGALIQLFVPSLSVANALRTVLHTMLGTSTPRLYGGTYGFDSDRWDDD